ncbi:MAG: DUF2797 domain-containing protein [Halobacteriovoraceae bacterium]|jgi:hypothetical protein|nr:DUF2797 domain-containing protein [Halobacteriovoraceae bacterium]
MKIGTLKKLESDHQDIVQYSLPIGDELVPLNELIGKKITLEHTGNIYCVDTGKKIKQSYGQGYCWESFTTLPQCDKCIFQPELCHYKKGTCRDPEWGEDYCLQYHVIYISLTSGLKVGITRQTQVPTRWIDQGAVSAIKLCTVKDRLTSGLVEVEIAKELGDKTNWRNMLKNEYEQQDLVAVKASILEKFKPLLAKYQVEIANDDLYTFNYPVEKYPSKVTALNFDKEPLISATLLGIKGQYLIFDTGVINIRKFQGYEVKIEC